MDKVVRKNKGYMPQLDALRAIAIALVIIQHYFEKSFLNYLPNGKMGVLLFFVLSGYLISGILFKEKIKLENKTRDLKTILKNFYIRRTLRIFPIYYLLVIFLIFVNYNDLQGKAVWYLTYTSNIFAYLNQAWDGVTGPLWSLAVEEQFYIIWPVLLLSVPLRKMKTALIVLIAFGLIFRIIFMILSTNFSIDTNYELSLALMPSTLDSFGLGALLSYGQIYKQNKLKASTNKIIFITSVVIFIAINHFFKGTFIYYVFIPLSFSIISVYIVRALSKGVKGFGKLFLENRVIIYLGKISYGLYLYHIFPWFVYAVLNYLELKYSPFNYKILRNFESLFIEKSYLFVIVVIVISTISWFLVESPINNLKKHFKY